MPNKPSLKVKGKEGEDLAAAYLERKGFKILSRNFKTRWGEIDIVAQKKKEYFFIEVKWRQNDSHGKAIEQMPFYRLERFRKMTLSYAKHFFLLDKPLHLSLLGIDGDEGEAKVTFLPDITR